MWRCRPIVRRAKPGVTIIELLIAMALMTGFIEAVYQSVIVGLRAVDASQERGKLRQELDHALDLLTREASVANNVVQAQDQRFQFDADIDGDGHNENNINYQLQNGDLQRVYSGNTVTLVHNVTALDFNYLDLNGTNMATPVSGSSNLDNIRVAEVTITATNDQETLSMASAVFLRNNR